MIEWSRNIRSLETVELWVEGIMHVFWKLYQTLQLGFKDVLSIV